MTERTATLDIERSIIRLDQTRNPFAPCPAAVEALESHEVRTHQVSETQLRGRIGERHHVPVESILLVPGADAGLAAALRSFPGPRVTFPPSSVSPAVNQPSSDGATIAVARGPGQFGSISLETARDLPENCIAVVDSPSNPLGSLLPVTDAVRLARACHTVIVDERFAEFAGFSLVPLALEFENVVVVRSFEAWAGIERPALAWIVASPSVIASLSEPATAIAPAALAAAMATLDNAAAVDAMVRALREERSRLYRFVRKLSFLQPVPSWGPFLAACVELVPRCALVEGLTTRGIRVHAPPEQGLERFVRIGIGPRAAIEALRRALLDMAPELVS